MKKVTSTLTMALLCLYINAQVGTLDPTFNASGTPGFRIDNPSGLPDVYDFATAMAFTSDGKILVGGRTQNGEYFLLMRYTNAGVLDNTFGTGGVVWVRSESGNSAQGYGMVLQSDGKIVLAGWNWPTNKDFCVMRFNSDGSFDTGFGTGGKVTTDFGSGNDEGRNVALQSDGKIVVTGFSSNGTNTDFAVARYTTAGVLDGTFGTGGKVTTNINGDDVPEAIAINNTDGTITIAGTSNSSGNGNFSVVRYTSGGVLDATFGTGGVTTVDIGSGTDDQAHSLAVQTDGKLIIGGTTKPSANKDVVLLRLTTTGALDATFGTGGKVTANYDVSVNSDDDCRSIALQSDGKIVVGGSVDEFPNSNNKPYGFMLMRFTTSGALDATFSGDGKAAADISVTDNDNGLVVALNGDRIYLAGNSGQPQDLAIAAFKNDAISLPVVLTQFYGQKQTTKVVLQWTSSSEENVAQYIVERSSDGTAYKAIGSVTATGNSSTPKSYSFADQSPFTNTNNVYRLQIQDLNGSVTYSKILIIKFTTELVTDLQIFPNPVKSLLQVQLPDGFNGKTSLQVFNLNGLLVKSHYLTANGSALNTTLDVATLPTGVYMLKATDGSASATTRFVKQ